PLAVHALRVAPVVPALDRPLRGLCVAGPDGGPAEQAGASPDRGARRRAAGCRADGRAERGTEHGPDGRARDSVLRSRLVDARADLLRRELPTDGVVPL